MTSKWISSETGILRKSDFKEKKEELFVFGYSCKLFRNDDRALHIDQGKHLIPWMGEETLKIDRYDARGALQDLSRCEAPPGGYDWRVELTRLEQEVEQLCDEERYRALHTDEDEELMYKEEELKRLHAAGYGQVGFNYEAGSEQPPTEQPAEVDEPFVPTPTFKALFLHDIMLADTQKQNAIIEKTAKFIAAQGAQMEILIKAKQGDNPQFKFLNKGDELHPYYMALTALVKAGKWPEKAPELVEEKAPEHDEYLHPSLASTVIESAPSIPSIQYKPSADCDYTMLVSKMRGEGEGAAALAPGELPPPGTEPPAQYSHTPVMYNTQVPPPSTPAQTQAIYQQYAGYYKHTAPPQMKPLPEPLAPRDSTGLSLMQDYGTGTDSEPSDSEDSSNDKVAGAEPAPAVPPDDVKLFIEKMSTYVARNGDAFADIVRAKRDPRFSFLDPAHVYHPYYDRIMRGKRGEEVNGGSDHRIKPPVSFSIKKMKEPDPILPKPALPYESSSDEDPDKQTEKQEHTEDPKPAQLPPPQLSVHSMPIAVIYKMEGQLTHNLPTIKTIEPTKQYLAKQIGAKQIAATPPVAEFKDAPKPEINLAEHTIKDSDKIVDKEPLQAKEASKDQYPTVDISIEKESRDNESNRKEVSKESEKESRERDDNNDHIKEKKRHKDRREYRSKSESREKRSKSESRDKRSSRDREKKEKDRDREKKEKDREKDRDKKKVKVDKDDLESEIISLGDISDDMIDLTGDQSDSRECDSESDKAKQTERRRRAAEFLKKVGVDPAAAALPASSLASAMVDTLVSIRKKKAAEEEKRRRKEKRRRREKRDYEESEKSHRKSKRRKYKSSDDEESDYESGKKKKRKKDKKTSKKKKRRSEAVEEEAECDEQQLPASMDLSSTLKELRTNSPTKNLMIPDIGDIIADETSSEDDRDKDRKRKKRDREYSEGEWSSDSEADSYSSAEKRRKNEDKHVRERSPRDK